MSLLTVPGCRGRRERLLDALDVDWALCSSPQSLAAFAAFWPTPFLFNSQQAQAFLVIGRLGQSILFVDNVQAGTASLAFASETVSPLWYRCVESAPHRGQNIVSAVSDWLAKTARSKVAIEYTACPARLAARLAELNCHVSDFDLEFARQRQVKDPDEVLAIRGTIKAAEAGHAAARANVHAGMTELEAFGTVVRAVQQAASRQVEVYGDFASGPRCGKGGGPPTLRVIGPGDLFLFDFSVVDTGYRCDFANTFVCDGEPTQEMRRSSELCLAAMAAGEGALRPGAAGRAVHEAVRGVFAQAGVEGQFPHHAGHGVGLGHPERPFLVPESDDTLAAGNIVTLEPGLYNGEIGMRFERNYLITETGFENLTQHALGLA